MSDLTPALRDARGQPAREPGRASTVRLLLLTAVFPGLGHLVAGRRGWATALGLPLLVLLVALAGAAIIAVTTGSTTSLAARLFDPAVLGVLLALQGLVLAWRIGALGAARSVTDLRPGSTTSSASWWR